MSFKKLLLVFVVFSAIILNDSFCTAKSVDNRFYNLIEKRIVRSINEWDQKNTKYNLIGDWLILKKQFAAETKDVERSSRDNGLFERIQRFAKEHVFEMKFPWTSASVSEARSSKLKKFLIPFVVLMVLKKSIEIPIFLAVVSLVAFKGLGAGLIALMLSGATAFKSLLEQHHPSSKVSYEVVPQFGPTWSRSGVDYPNLDGYHTIPPSNNKVNQ